jgi:hypothetical protein
MNPCLSSVLRINWWGADQFDGPSGTPSSGSPHEIDVFLIFIADFRLRDSLEASEKLLQYIFHTLDVGLWCEATSTRLAIPSGEVFDEHVPWKGGILSQALGGRDALRRHETGWIQSAVWEEKRELKPAGKPTVRAGHPHYPLIQGLLLVLFIPGTGVVLCLQSTVLIFMRSRYPAVLLRCSLVVLGGASSTPLELDRSTATAERA